MFSSTPEIVLAALAFPTLLICIGWTYQFIWLHFIHQSQLNCYLKRNASTGDTSSWALVTGASDGIGFGFVQELASRGFSVILHGRNKTKLEGLIDQVRKQHPSQQFKMLIVDASERDGWKAVLEDFVSDLKSSSIDLRVLVNNVGGTGGNFFAFDRMTDRDPDAITKTIDMNVSFPTALTHVLLPYLMEKKPSLIINIGSAAAVGPIPYLAMYAASKAFNLYWSDSLNAEMYLEDSQVEVLGVVVGKVINANTRGKAASLFEPTARDFARATLGKVGCGLPSVTAYWPHDLQVSGVKVLPKWIVRRVLAGTAVSSMAEERKGR